MVIPQNALALYISPNPRNLIKATKESIKELTDLILEDYSGYNPQSIVMNKIQTASKNNYFRDFDFDKVDMDSTIESILKVINKSAVHVIQTRGGFHVLVKVNCVEDKYKKTWYQNIVKLEGCDVRDKEKEEDRCILPVPGCTQGGFVPKIIF